MRNYRFKVKRNGSKTILNMRVMFKKCNKCGKVLFKSNFYKDKSHPSGLVARCIECKNSKYTHTCEQCGKEFNSKKKEQRFCSFECQGKWQTETRTGENSSNWQGGKIIVSCSYCGKEIELDKNRIKRSKNLFCSTECHGLWKSENLVSESNHNYKKEGHIKCNCDYCNKEFETTKTKYNKSKNHFCSRECQGKWQSENIRGENHPCYGKEGLKGENHPSYNPNLTQEEREQGRNIEGYSDFIKGVYERDNYTCQCCGDNKGHNLNAHHIYGYAEYKDLRTDVDNGTVLCEDCHKRYHKQYGYKNNNYKDFRTFLYNEMMKQNTLEAKLFYINTIEDITLRLEIRGLLELKSA